MLPRYERTGSYRRLSIPPSVLVACPVWPSPSWVVSPGLLPRGPVTKTSQDQPLRPLQTQFSLTWVDARERDAPPFPARPPHRLTSAPPCSSALSAAFRSSSLLNTHSLPFSPNGLLRLSFCSSSLPLVLFPASAPFRGRFKVDVRSLLANILFAGHRLLSNGRLSFCFKPSICLPSLFAASVVDQTQRGPETASPPLTRRQAALSRSQPTLANPRPRCLPL